MIGLGTYCLRAPRSFLCLATHIASHLHCMVPVVVVHHVRVLFFFSVLLLLLVQQMFLRFFCVHIIQREKRERESWLGQQSEEVYSNRLGIRVQKRVVDLELKLKPDV